MTPETLRGDIGLGQESLAAFEEGVDATRSGAGASVGGAAKATAEQLRGLAAYGLGIFNETRRPHYTALEMRGVSPAPYPGFNATALSLPPNVELDLHEIIYDSQGKPLPYLQMVQAYKEDEVWVEQRVRQLEQAGFSIGNYWVDAAVRQHLVDQMEAPKRSQLGRFTVLHSSPSHVIQAESPDFYAKNPSSPEQIQHELDAFANTQVVFFTVNERNLAIRSLTGIEYAPGKRFTADFLERNTFVAPLSIDARQFERDPSGEKKAQQRKQFFEQYGVSNEDLVYLYLGRLDTEKGYDQLIEAHMLYLEECVQREDTISQLPKLICVGGAPLKNPALYSRYEELVHKISDFESRNPSLKGWIILPGEPLPHAAIANVADMEIYPSQTETFSIAPKEANMAGVPVALSEIAAHTETHGDTALMFKTDSYADFAEMLEAGRDPKLRAELAEAGWRNSQRFTREAATRSLINGMRKTRPDLFA